MEIKKLDNISPDLFPERNIIKKGELIVARIIKRNGPNNVLVEIKGKNYSALIKGAINGDIFLARAVKITPEFVLKFIKTLGKMHIKSNISRNFFDYKKEFIQKLIASDNFVVDSFVEIGKDKILAPEKDLIPLLKKYLANWYTPLLDKNFTTQDNTNYVQKLFHRFIIFQELYNLYNLEHLSFMIPLRLQDRKLLFNIEILNREDDLSKSVLIKVYLDDKSDILLLLYLDQKVISCSLSSNNDRIRDNLKKEKKLLYEALRNKVLTKRIEINMVPYDYLAKMDGNNFKTIDIRM